MRPSKRVREIVEAESGSGSDPALWARMAELGWVGLNMPEAHGGVGLDLETLLVVLEETGRSLFPSPLISTVPRGQGDRALWIWRTAGAVVARPGKRLEDRELRLSGTERLLFSGGGRGAGQVRW